MAHLIARHGQGEVHDARDIATSGRATDQVIPRSRDNPEFRWVYDTEIVRDLIAPLAPVRWHVLAQESQHRDTEILERGVALVVGGVSVHQSP